MLPEFHQAVAACSPAITAHRVRAALVVAFAGAVLVSACTSEAVLRPDVDVGAQTSAIVACRYADAGSNGSARICSATG